MVVRDWRLFGVVRRFKPDVILAREGLFACQVGWLSRTPAISFDDTDDAPIQQRLYFPFAWRIYTDKAYRVSIGRKQRFYKGVSCLAYLHPSIFTPDDSVLRHVGLGEGERFTLCRLVSWTANHDYGHHGFDRQNLKKLVEGLSAFGRVLITSETPLPEWLQEHRIVLPAHQMHHLMAKASLYIGESATMAAECAVLGVPAVFVSTLSTWYTQHLEQTYGLVRNVENMKDCLAAALGILKDPSSRETLRQRRDRYLADTDDLVEVVLKALEEVPVREN
jgi:predicted glycosyltransferase